MVRCINIMFWKGIKAFMFSSRWVLITLSTWILFQLCLGLENWFLGSSICFICETHLFYVWSQYLFFFSWFKSPTQFHTLKKCFSLLNIFLVTWKKRSPEHFFSPFFFLLSVFFFTQSHMKFFFSPESFLKCFPRLKNKQMKNLQRLWNDFKHREKTTTKNPHCPSGLSYKGYKEGW